MAVGTFLAASALVLFGGFNYVWVIVAGIVCFSLGEMLSSPKSSEYLGNIAPAQKKAMYLGFSQFPIGIGWTLESIIAPLLYGHFGAKETIARQTLLEEGWSSADVDAIAGGEAFQTLVDFTGKSANVVTAQLYEAASLGKVWYVMAAVGIVAAAGMYVYGRWTYKLKE
jgi:MFS family permease